MEAIRFMPDFIIPDKDDFSAREVARILGVSLFTITTAINNGDIHTEQGKTVLGLPSNRRVIPRLEVERLARQKGLL